MSEDEQVVEDAASQALLELIRSKISKTPRNFNIAQAKRRLLLEGKLDKVSKGKTQTRYVYLFNDVMIWCRIKTTENHEYKGHAELRHLLIQDAVDDQDALIKEPKLGTPRLCSLQLIRMDDKKKKYILKFRNDDEKTRWKTAIQDVLDGWLEIQKHEYNSRSEIGKLQLSSMPSSTSSTPMISPKTSRTEHQPVARIFTEEDSLSLLEEVRKGNEETVKYLLTQGHADAFYLGPEQVSASCYAAEQGLDKILAILIGVDPEVLNQKTPSLLTPLHYAAMNGHDDCVSLILRTEKTITDESGTQQKKEVVDVSATDDAGLSASDHAVLNNRFSTFKILDERAQTKNQTHG